MVFYFIRLFIGAVSCMHSDLDIYALHSVAIVYIAVYIPCIITFHTVCHKFKYEHEPENTERGRYSNELLFYFYTYF